jgi:hypothetical protein
MGQKKTPMAPLEASLFKLEAERELGAWAGQFIDPRKALEDDGSDGNQGKPIALVEDALWDLALKIDAEKQKSDEKDFAPTIIPEPCVTAIPSAAKVPGMGQIPIRKEPVIVIIRHGKTEHNKLGLFTGWEDAPLALEGIAEAREAGRLLKLHGFEFDVVYSSWLSRAIETAWCVLNEMDSLWLPIIKSWRLVSSSRPMYFLFMRQSFTRAQFLSFVNTERTNVWWSYRAIKTNGEATTWRRNIQGVAPWVQGQASKGIFLLTKLPRKRRAIQKVHEGCSSLCSRKFDSYYRVW